MGFFNFNQDRPGGGFEVSSQGWIYLVCTLPLTFVVLTSSFVWMWWTGTKEVKPFDYSAGQALAQAANVLMLGAGPRKEAV